MAYGRHQHRAAMVRRAALVVVPATIALFGATAAVGAPTSESPPADAIGARVPTGDREASAAVVASQPPDRQSYSRPAETGDRLVSPALPAGYVLVDTVVSNTDPNLKDVDAQSDSEPSLAINGANPNEIVITGFSSSWNTSGNAAVFRSTNGGSTWTKAFSVPPPTGVATGPEWMSVRPGHRLRPVRTAPRYVLERRHPKHRHLHGLDDESGQRRGMALGHERQRGGQTDGQPRRQQRRSTLAPRHSRSVHRHPGQRLRRLRRFQHLPGQGVGLAR